MAQTIGARPGRPAAPEVEAQVQALLTRPYRMVVRGEPDGGYLAEAPELPGCLTAGETPEEAMALLRDAMAGWFEVALERGATIPEPSGAAAPELSGKFLVRLPKTLHGQLAARADAEGVSLNQLVMGYLARGVGGGEGPEHPSMERLIEIAAALPFSLRRALIAARVWAPFDPANRTITGPDGTRHTLDPQLVAPLVKCGFLKRKPLPPQPEYGLPGRPESDTDVLVPPASAAALRLADQLLPV